CDPHNSEKPWDKKLADYWMPVDCYVGGAEHAVMHLLYARFWTKVLYDEGLVSVTEPFAQLRNQGQVLAQTPYRYPREGEQLGVGEDGVLISFEEAKELPENDVFFRWARMSKSKGNVVTPEEAVEEYGADALRMFLLFVAPFDADVNWKNEGMGGMVRFLSRIFKFIEDGKATYVSDWRDYMPFEELDDKARDIRRATHQTIRNCTADIERFSFNTYVSWLQKYVNRLHELQGELSRPAALAMSEAIETLILLIGPGAPHSSDELWTSIGKEGFTLEREWPKHDDALAAEDLLTIAVQVNGKLRDTFQVAAETAKDEYERLALLSSKVQGHLEGKTVRKVIVVPGRLVNVVAS
ncbi:MAG: class I tRNA ligase family protein, partial [Fimbriimonas sp.]